jgi:transaldolase
MTFQELKVKLYADGADKQGMVELYRNPLIQGLTTNPTLMKKSGVTDYEAFARDVLAVIKDKPISFEVLCDEFPEMRRQALKIKSWQSNVYVKIPVMNSRGESSLPLIRELGQEGVQINVTAVMELPQVNQIAEALHPKVSSIVSVFAGRIADTGRDPMPDMRASRELLRALPKAELLWASVREVLNIFQADECGSHIVTVPHEILKKALDMWGTDLHELSLATVRMFARDAQAAGLALKTQPALPATAGR